MDKSGLLAKLLHSSRLEEIIGVFRQHRANLLHGGTITQQALILALALAKEPRRAVVVVPDKNTLRKWRDNFSFFAPDIAIGEFPVLETTSFAVTARSHEREAERTRSLALLTGQDAAVVLLTAEELGAQLPAPELLKEKILALQVGDLYTHDQLLHYLVDNGYERVDQVESYGHFAVRGDIVDIYSPHREYPLRIEFFGDEIDSLRYFHTDTQRSEEQVEKATLWPLTCPQGKSGLGAYLSGGLWLVDEPAKIAQQLQTLRKENPERKRYIHSWKEVLSDLATPTRVYFSLISKRVPEERIYQSYPIEGRGITAFRKQWPLLVATLRKWLHAGRAVVLAIGDESKKATLLDVLKEAEIFPSDQVAAGFVTVLTGIVEAGFEWPYEKVVLLTESDLFGTQKTRRRIASKKGMEIRHFSNLREGDYVVHQIHGIGRYTGVQTIETDGIQRDYLRIEYAGEDKLFLPAERITHLEKYIAPEGAVPVLHRMGGAQWTKAKARAKRSVDDLAERLVSLYAERELTEGFAYPPDTPWQREFEDAFPYEETPDQLQAIAEIKASMEKAQPMDRLLCGDVGFGKTEVAMRAAFKAVMSGKQVAVLVPTTVLSQQHMRVFAERLSPFGVNVAVLNRFRNAAEKKDTLRKVKDGQVDVLIGTHALLNKKVEFSDLGLLIVDEEQRFGVAQKEKWKERAANIDILTLSATPIPRTLHMSLAGVRELSVIYTAPEERQPVQTFVAEAGDDTIRSVLWREYERGGQSYFVYNRIASIEKMTEKLQELLPDEMTFDIAHGAMSGEELERVMQDFYAGRFDVLVCTSLVENGLDQPNANTIIVYDADRFGLSQLYQMRGRVGRSSRDAYAYFLYRPDKILTEDAEKRLYAIQEFTELGAGFKIAMRDLEIRGAGNLLGAEQHGNMVGVGFTAYCAMLDEAIAAHQGRPQPRQAEVHPILELQVEAYLPDDYIPDPAQKLEMYRRLAEVDTETELSDLTDELIDRFGNPPLSAETLLEVARLRVLARASGIGLIRELNAMVEIQWARPEAMARWDIGAVPDEIMKRIRFLPSDMPRATINKIQWNMPAIDFLPELLHAFLQRTEGEECE